MIILGVDTATWAGSVALADENRILGIMGFYVESTHSGRLMNSIDFLLKSLKMNVKELDGVAVSAGPGSFTGLRIGIGATKGLALALHKPAVGVSTLKAMACSIKTGDLLCPLIDAGRGEVYGCCYRLEEHDLAMVHNEVVIDPIELLNAVGDADICVFGTGAEKHRPQIERASAGKIIQFDHFIAPAVARLGLEHIREGRIAPLTPYYIRKSDAELQAEGRGKSE